MTRRCRPQEFTRELESGDPRPPAGFRIEAIAGLRHTRVHCFHPGVGIRPPTARNPNTGAQILGIGAEVGSRVLLLTPEADVQLPGACRVTCEVSFESLIRVASIRCVTSRVSVATCFTVAVYLSTLRFDAVLRQGAPKRRPDLITRLHSTTVHTIGLSLDASDY